MSTSDDKANAKPFDSDYYKWSYGISESRKVSVFRFLNHWIGIRKTWSGYYT